MGEVTSQTVDLSWQNEMLVTDYLVTYVPTGPGGLLQELTVPGDNTAATVKGLEPGIEYLISVYAVLNSKRSVPVSARVATGAARPPPVLRRSRKSSSRGSALVLILSFICVSRTSTTKGFDIQISARDLGGGDVGPSGRLL